MNNSHKKSIGITFLGSGSKGNAAMLELDGNFYVLDAGLSCRTIEQFLAVRGKTLADIHGIIITHGHGDHVKGLATLLKRTQAPIFASPGTWKEIQHYSLVPNRFIPLPRDREIELEGIRIWAFRVPHDALEPVGLRLESHGGSVAIATDLGHITAEAMHHLTDSDIVCLESNYDEEMLASCAYPGWLKTRIRGPLGHLPNTGTRGVLSRLKRSLSHLVLVHVSQESNTPGLVLENLEPIRSLPSLRNATVTVAAQDKETPTLFVNQANLEHHRR